MPRFALQTIFWPESLALTPVMPQTFTTPDAPS